MYGGLSLTFFFLVLFLQQVAGYDALQAGLATLPSTVVMFLLSKRFGALADRFGPRAFMGGGPLVAAAGLALFTRMPADVDYVADVLPGLLLFSLGLALTVAPLTATVLSDADESNAGIASGVNNAIARVAGPDGDRRDRRGRRGDVQRRRSTTRSPGKTLTPAAQQAVAEAQQQTLAQADTTGLPPREASEVASAVEDSSVEAFHVAMGIAAALVALGGLAGAVGIVNPRRRVAAEDCAGGQLVGAPEDVADCWEPGHPVLEEPVGSSSA